MSENKKEKKKKNGPKRIDREIKQISRKIEVIVKEIEQKRGRRCFFVGHRHFPFYG
jgi:hypothetical protein